MSNEMNDKHKEHLSAFIDNEVGPDELADLTSGDALLHRYQLMGDAIKGNLCDASFVDVSAQVSMALEKEAAHSVSKVTTSQKTSSQKTSSQKTSSKPLFDFGAWLRPVGGMAIAASVAVVMVMVVNQPESGDIGISSGGQIAVDTRPVVSLPVNNVQHGFQHNANTTKSKDELEEELRLKRMNTENNYPQK